MTTPAEIQFKDVDLDAVAEASGKVVVFVGPDGKLDAGARKVNTLTRKALTRFLDGAAFEKMALGDVATLAYPAGMSAAAICVVKLGRRPGSQEARKAGAQLAKAQGGKELLVMAGSIGRAATHTFVWTWMGYGHMRHNATHNIVSTKNCDRM